MKVLVISGFLGAGKTTFIEALVKEMDARVVVLENEYGQVGIDGDVLKKDAMTIWELTEGCICCSMQANFASSILTIANTLNPEILLIEPTGIGLLSAVMENIQKIAYDRIEVLAPLAIVDPHSVDYSLSEYRDIFIDQIQNASRVIISKHTHASPDLLAHTTDTIHRYAPHIPIDIQDFNTLVHEKKSIFFEPVELKRYVCAQQPTQQIENIGFNDISFDHLIDFESTMSAIMQGRFGKVVRAKGFLPIAGVWGRVDIVNTRYTLCEIDAMERSKLIIIGKDLDKHALTTLFTAQKHGNNA